MKKRRKHTTTKNTMSKPTVTRHAVIEGDCNGHFKIATDLTDDGTFDKIYMEWFDSPDTRIWNIESFIVYFSKKFPKNFCILYDEYKAIAKDKGVIPATKQEWESENN
jgi:hypothetical protein